MVSSLQCSTNSQGRVPSIRSPPSPERPPISAAPHPPTALHHRLCQCWEYSQLHFSSEFKYQCRTGISGEQERECKSWLVPLSKAGTSNSQPMGRVEPGMACSLQLFPCSVPSCCQLCPNKWPSTATGKNPSLTAPTMQCLMGTFWYICNFLFSLHKHVV